MSKRLIISLSLGLSVVLTISLVLASASVIKVEKLPFIPRTDKPARTVKSKRQIGSAALQRPALLDGQSATLLPDGRWLLVGGESKKGPLSTAVIVDAHTNVTSPLPSALAYPRAWHSATMLPDGTVLILGGTGAGGRLVGEAEIFSPEAQSFKTLLNSGLTPRAGHSATVLTDGRMLIAGGVTSRGRMLGKVEVWDPRTGTGSALHVGLQILRQKHWATLLSNGTVLLAGGSGKTGTDMNRGEIFNPETQSFSPVETLSEEDDAQAPYLAASSPKEGDQSVPGDVCIALRFSKPLRVETVHAQTIRLTGPGGAVAGKVVPAENGRLAFITPQEQLLPGTNYTLSLSGSTDLSNVSLAPASYTFTTAGTQEHEHDPESTHERTPAASSQMPTDQVWAPEAKNLKGDWRSGRPDPPARILPALQAESGVTALAGQVLTLSGSPLANVTLQVGENSTVTDRTGRFLLTPATAGQPLLIIRGDTASRPGTTYGTFEALVDITAGKTNVLPYTIWLPVLDEQHATRLPSPTTRELAVTTPLVPGMEVRVPSGVVLRMPPGHGMSLMKGNMSHVMDSIAITPIPVDRSPFPLPPGVDQALLFTLQLHGAKVEGPHGEKKPGLRIIFPNYLGLPAGSRASFWNYEATRGGWYQYGLGTVTQDGRQVVPDPGVELNSMYCISYMTKGEAPDSGPTPCGGCEGGDPVDLSTGLFIYEKTDLYLPDVMPISVARTYRQNDGGIRAFGKGATHPYNMFIEGDTFNHGDMILPDGGRIRFNKNAAGIFEHTETPSRFYKATLMMVSSSYAGYDGGWDVKLLDGTIYHFYQKTLYGDIFGVHSTATGLHSIEDRYGNKIFIERDGRRRPIKITSPNSRRIEFTYDGNSERITQAKDSIGRVVTYEYYPGGELRKVTDPNNGVTEYTYDGASRMLTIKDARGIVYLTNEYDANGRVKKQTQADGTTFQFAYTLNTSNQVIQTDLTDPRGNVRRATFNSSGYWLTDTYALGKPEQQTITYERQAGDSKVISATDALGRKTVYSYYPTGSVKDITYLAETAAAATTSFTYDSRYEQVKTVTDPLSHTTTYGYDEKGNLITVTDPLNHTTTYAYNTQGQIVSVTDHLQHAMSFIYDSGDLVEVRDPLGHSVTRYLDGAGRAIRVTDALGRTTKYQYDALNQVKKVIDPIQGETSFTYDENGNLKSVTDARGKVTSYTYDLMDQVETRTDPLLKVERYAYDESGNLKKFTDRRNKVTSYRYDALGRSIFVGFGTTGEGESASYESTISYTYDAAGRLKQAVDSVSGTITRSYDNVARTSSETTAQGLVSYGYDAAGRRTSMTVMGQPAVSYAYDNANRLTSITQGTAVVGFNYDEVNRRSALTLPNGVTVTYGYDDASRLTSLTYKRGATALGDLSYEYDAAGRRAKMGGSYARQSLPQALATATHNDVNQLTQRGTTTLSYDEGGNLTNDGVNTYAWNARNQLQSISGSTSASFQYDAFGRRVSNTINGQTTGYLYDGMDAVQEQAGGSPVVNVLNGGVDEVFTRTDSLGTQMSRLADGLGSTLALTDSAGSVQTSYTYEPFGNTTSSGSASTNRSEYTGRENDGTGLYYYRARYYSPTLQRFISEDPIGMAGGINLYAYVENNSISFIDPLGTDKKNGGMTPSDWFDMNYWAALADAMSYYSDFGAGNAIGLADPNPVELSVYLADKYGGPPKLYAGTIDLFGFKGGVIYRGGGTSPGNFKPGTDGGVSFRDSLSNPYPLKPGERPIFHHGGEWSAVRTCDLPSGSTHFDGGTGPYPPGHVSVKGVPPETLSGAAKAAKEAGLGGRFPK